MLEEKNYYRVRAFPNHIDRFSDFIENNYIAIGWPAIGDITTNSKQDISDKLAKYYPNLNKQALGLTTGFFTRLLSMKPKDIILIPYNNEIVVIAEVTAPYSYNSEFEGSHTAHRVSIKQIKTLSVKELPSNLKKSVGTIATVVSLNKYGTELNQLISNEYMSIQKNPGLVFIAKDLEKHIILQISDEITEQDLRDFISKIKL